MSSTFDEWLRGQFAKYPKLEKRDLGKFMTKRLGLKVTAGSPMVTRLINGKTPNEREFKAVLEFFGQYDPQVAQISNNFSSLGSDLAAMGLSSPGDAYDSGKQEGLMPVSMGNIPVYDIRASAGGGALVNDEAKQGYMALDKSWAKNFLGIDPYSTYLVSAFGDSMEPTIRSGEYVVCSKAAEHLNHGEGIFVIRLDGTILLKRLQRIGLNAVRISSDNTHYSPREIQFDEATDFEVLGKVVFIFRRV